MQETMRGFSRGMYSNWLWHRPLQLLVDAGEGLQIALGANVFSPSILADHARPFRSCARPPRLARGAAVRQGRRRQAFDHRLSGRFRWCPGGARMARPRYADVVFPLNWIAATPGTAVPLGKNKQLEAISVRHTRNEVALGYRVVETRKRLKPEFAALPQAGHRSRRRGKAPGTISSKTHGT
jgi:ribonuclease Z